MTIAWLEYATEMNAISRARVLQYQTSFFSFFINQGFLIRKALWKEIREYASSANGKILDFGCGSKPYETAFSVCESYTGVDVRQSGHNHENSRIDVLYDGKNLPFLNRTFDKVVCFEVFEHLENPTASLEEIARVLKIGGELFITTPFIYGEHEIPFDFQRWTNFGLERFIEKNNFKIVKVKKLNSNFGVIAQLFFDQFFSWRKVSRITYLSILRIPFITLANFIVMVLSLLRIRNQNLYSNLVCIAVLENVDPNLEPISPEREKF